MKAKSLWVRVSVIKEKTQWKTDEQMRTARVNGYIKYKKDFSGMWYLWQSVNPIFYEKPQL